MKKILLSLLTVGTVAVVALTATTAFFSDTETSEGNLFQSGAIDLRVDSQQHYAGMVCVDGVWVDEDNDEDNNPRPELLTQECGGTWELTDLGPANKFFNFFDLKPGDYGENTISLHVDSNDAWMCAIIDNMHDDDLGLTEPEAEDGDTTDGPDQGELASELHFFAWADDGGQVPGNNIWEDGEQILFSNTEGPASDVLNGVAYPMYTPQSPWGAFPGGETRYIGMYWCYGDITVDEGENTLACSGEAVTNLSQTDQLTADITFYVEQARNNPDFTCPQPENVERVFVGASLASYVGPDENECDETISTDIQGAVNSAADGATICVNDGDYSETVVIDKPLTLAAVNGPLNSAVIEGGIQVDSSDVTITGFVINPGDVPADPGNIGVFINGSHSNIEISFNEIDGTGIGNDRGVLTSYNASIPNLVISHNDIHDLVSGIYLNPHTGAVVVSQNDIHSNTSGLGGFTGVHVAYNEFMNNSDEAVGADSSYDGVSVLEYNNFLTGDPVIKYGAWPAYDANPPAVIASNNFWDTGAASQVFGNVDYTPEAGAQYPHN